MPKRKVILPLETLDTGRLRPGAVVGRLTIEEELPGRRRGRRMFRGRCDCGKTRVITSEVLCDKTRVNPLACLDCAAEDKKRTIGALTIHQPVYTTVDKLLMRREVQRGGRN